MTETCSCHCGNIEITVAHLPEKAISCNCSICRRLASWWARYPKDLVTIHHQQQPTVGYIWGDRCIEFHHCPICGCTTHYSNAENHHSDDMAINARMFNLEQRKGIHIRQFDGADSFTFIDE